MGVLSDDIFVPVKERYDVTVSMKDGERNWNYVNLKQLGIDPEHKKTRQIVYEIIHRIGELFDDMTSNLDELIPIVERSGGTIISHGRYGRVHVEKVRNDFDDDILKALEATYYAPDETEVINVKLYFREWVC